MGPKNFSKTSLEPKITAKNAFSDLIAHTNVVRNAFALPLAVVPSRLVDIEFDPKISFFLHFFPLLWAPKTSQKRL